MTEDRSRRAAVPVGSYYQLRARDVELTTLDTPRFCADRSPPQQQLLLSLAVPLLEL